MTNLVCLVGAVHLKEYSQVRHLVSVHREDIKVIIFYFVLLWVERT